MGDQTTVTAGKVVSIHYTLTDDQGNVIDSSREGRPLDYLHGANNIVPGLERQMEGKNLGESVAADVSPEEGYGQRRGPGPQGVPRQAFPANITVQPGMQFVAQDPSGNAVPVWVTDVQGDTVYIDQNHPLAGQTLHFAVEVMGVRDATEEERQHGHPHGPEGHRHE